MKNTILIILFFITSISFAQSVKLEGLITDSKSVGLEMANVMAVNKATKAMDSYAITNDKGKFLLNLKPNTAYSLKISYLGMQNKELEITTTSENNSRNIALEEGGIELDGVEIVREMPVSIKGDTIVYNADSFKSGTERKLEDILKKLPGVEVNADGEIEVEGKKVSKLMVEGKDFFDGDTKLGVKNIPADAIDKIQVLRNYSEIGALKGVENNQDNIAMNIKLKSGKKNFWFGDMTAGVGVAHEESRYLINPKIFYYNPKYSISVITNLNNIGELPLTVQDYFKFTGGFRGMMQKGGSSFNVSSNDLGISLLRNNRAKEIETKFGATNFSYNVNKAWSLSGFGIISSSLTDLETKSQTNILQPNSSAILSTENRQEIANQKSNLGLFKLSSSYKPTTRFQFDYDVLTKLSKQDENNSLLRESIVAGNSATENINTVKKQDPISVNQNLSLYYTQSDKNIFAFEMQHLYQEENPFYNANLKSQPFNLADYISGQNRNDINQNRFVKTNKLDSKFDYYYMVTPKSNINLTLGNTYSYQNFDSSIFQMLDDGSQNNLSSTENSNNVNYSFNDVFLGVHYKFLLGKFTFNPGFSVHQYNMNDEQLGTSNKQSFNRILPDVYALWQIKKSETLTYNYSLTNNFTDINKLAQGYVFSNYNSLFSGNRYLENSTSQVHSLRYFKYNMFNFENIFANISYTRQLEGIKNRALLVGVNQISSAVNINSSFPDETLSATGNYGRSFAKYYKANARAGVNWSKFNNIRVFPDSDSDPNNNPTKIQTTESVSQSYGLSFSTNYKTLPNLTLGYNFTINDNFSDVIYVDSPTVTLEYFFLDAFSFVSEYSYYHNRNKSNTIDSEYDFLTASLMYQKKDSKWEWKLSGTNLLDTKSLDTNSFSQLGGTSTFSSYRVQPRFVILSLKYRL